MKALDPISNTERRGGVSGTEEDKREGRNREGKCKEGRGIGAGVGRERKETFYPY